MTIEQHMHVRVSRISASVAAIVLVVCSLLSAGCVTTSTELRFPTSHVAPYSTIDGDVLWAVAPLRNETGVSVVDTLAIADSFAATFQEVRGVSVVPVNRTLGAMRAMGIQSVDSASDARRLAMELGVDAIVVGSVTAWDPYNPPRIGLSLALYGRPGTDRLGDGGAVIDPRTLTAAASDNQLPSARGSEAALSVASAHLDAANHEVLMAVQRYAEGRHNPETALGWRGYLASMSLFTKFACHQMAGRLLDQERLRLAREHAGQQASAR